MKHERMVIRVDRFMDANGNPFYSVASDNQRPIELEIGTALSVLCDSAIRRVKGTVPEEIKTACLAMEQVLTKFITNRGQ